MTAEPQSHLAWIALGSNIKPERNLTLAVQLLGELGNVLKCSSVWQSQPVGDLHQADFWNAAALLATTLDPHSLKSALRDLETRLGRVRNPLNKNAARTIDLDIAFYDDLIIDKNGLCIPDPEIADRPFLAVPLAELNADFRHPVTRERLADIATAAGGKGCLVLRAEIRL
ncbi:2-amino-4-hydroxy-6-hydroxymethyldihydropteridine diphosphokinase [Planctomicrobium piriforme]|uniref:2-amino-4-hydroxy-6-hydroxymethyldihydropteridine pyrophosphokinase n=1 Tax=Planctomicrobium piriforme TaxID=1576369 RepID=A0A1I3QCX6_9PLAN|nr:2-amino-4-hydroxy-6-hydroxymethyldihydropteridine diphosphokinase [Planctomicrobium piriforme]SFJ31585.1 2-amino-4-hydroxy-6-hydroxymethyldihydropteridinediphosphokinase/dihydroneopterin aldolase / 2-amino-4-hydroxy-6-hydroxymethyldihydropteridine diphosphokinase [Planctomicrobium piriforme]